MSPESDRGVEAEDFLSLALNCLVHAQGARREGRVQEAREYAKAAHVPLLVWLEQTRVMTLVAGEEGAETVPGNVGGREEVGVSV